MEKKGSWFSRHAPSVLRLITFLEVEAPIDYHIILTRGAQWEGTDLHDMERRVASVHTFTRDVSSVFFFDYLL